MKKRTESQGIHPECTEQHRSQGPEPSLASSPPSQILRCLLCLSDPGFCRGIGQSGWSSFPQVFFFFLCRRWEWGPVWLQDFNSSFISLNSTFHQCWQSSLFSIISPPEVSVLLFSGAMYCFPSLHSLVTQVVASGLCEVWRVGRHNGSDLPGRVSKESSLWSFPTSNL